MVSVIVPTFQRPMRLAACLEALARQRCDSSDFDVVVVDDDGGSDPAIAATVAGFRQHLDISLIPARQGGPATARNRGADTSRGRFLAFTDDDCEPHPDWLVRLLEVFANSPDVVIGGSIRCGLEGNCFSMASQDLVSFLYHYYNRQDGPMQLVVSNNLAVPRSIFERLGGFDIRFQMAAAEDRDFSHRCGHAGIKMIYQPRAIVVHKHELTARAFSRQHFNYGRGAFIYHRTCADDGRGEIPLEPLGFYRDLVLHPLRRQLTAEAAVSSSLLVLSQAANACGFFWEKLRA